MGFNSFREEGSRKGLLFFGAGMLCLLLAGGLVFFYSGKFSGRPSGQTAGPALSLSPPAVPKTEVGEKSPPDEGKKKLWVLYITGEVSAPGVYTLSSDVRIVDLVDAAGGLTPKADPVRINLAAPLSDGMHIHVPAMGSTESFAPSLSLPQSPSSSFSAPAEGASSGPVNVNSATLQELERLPGVGPATARAILEYRTSRGYFSSVEDLLRVKGIGPKKLEGMRRAVTLR
ncbi:MAG: ComEA family DNA-binding protein [Synergistaceae bacterium]|nr:ComEA family DNA-binding protein [Synergistaceae bacterium]